MADLCLVSMPALGRAKSAIVPHWILWLAGYVENKGYTVDVVDIKSNVNADYSEKEKERVFQETVEKAVASQSPFIGLSAFTEDYFAVTALATEIKRRSNAKVVIGGIHASISPEDYFARLDSPFDVAVVGDGEVPLCRLIESGKNKSVSWEEINGLVFRKGNEIVHSLPQKQYPVLDDIPMHPYHKLDMSFYLQPQQHLLRSIYLSGVHIFTARGCPYGCTFCANRRKKVRFRSLDSVIDELRYLKESYDIDGFYIHDDTFTIKNDRVVEFCEKLIDLKYRFAWGMEGRVNQFPENVFHALKESGCIQIDFGVESGSQESLNRMKKGIKIEDTLQVFRRCTQEKIRTYANILINTPEETEEDVKKTIELMENIHATTYGICVTTPFPGTEIYDRYVHPPLRIDEYTLYCDGKTYSSIVDSRFRLASHQLNLEEIAAQLCQRFMINKGWQIFSLHPSYLNVLLKSRRKAQYLSVFIYRLLRKLRNVARRFLPVSEQNSRPMNSRRIIIASTDIGIGGLGSYLKTLMVGLKSRGWDVHLLVTNVHGNYFDEMSRSFSCHDVSAIPLSPKKVFMTADLANSIMPDVILTNNCALMHYAIPLIDPKIKTISVLHSDDSRFYAIGAIFSGRLFRWIAPTAGLAARFHKFVDQRLQRRIRVIPHGINRSRFFPKKTKNNGSARQILFVGFLGESKGADLLPDIFQKVAAAIPDSFLTIIGDGPLKVHLDTEFRKRGLQKRILMQGATSPDETAKIMRASHILLLPTNLEGFGIVIVEAMMCGVVPVVSRLTGITDQLVQQGETGLLVTPLDINGFAEAVKMINGDTKLYQAMSLKACRVAAETFSVDRMIDRYEALFAEPDDRDSNEKLGMLGWYEEAAIQFLRKRMK